jgi:hypothetical protein
MKHLALLVALTSVVSAAPKSDDDTLWDSVYESREKQYRERFGPLPREILKMLNMTGVWPGGGLVKLKSERLKNTWVYSTFGLTNSDMPTDVRSVEIDAEHFRVVPKEKPPKPVAGRAGYGYELIVLTKDEQDWALDILQWAVQVELNDEVGFLDRVKLKGGITIEALNVGEAKPVNLLIAPALASVAKELRLPNGEATLLVATVISEEDMRFALSKGPQALLDKLARSPRKQVSALPPAEACRETCRKLLSSGEIKPGTTQAECEKSLCP